MIHDHVCPYTQHVSLLKTLINSFRKQKKKRLECHWAYLWVLHKHTPNHIVWKIQSSKERSIHKSKQKNSLKKQCKPTIRKRFKGKTKHKSITKSNKSMLAQNTQTIRHVITTRWEKHHLCYCKINLKLLNGRNDAHTLENNQGSIRNNKD